MAGREKADILKEQSCLEKRLADLDQERDQITSRLADLDNELAMPLRADTSNRKSRDTQRQAPTLVTSGQKVALFMDLFKGREDVYAKRWVNPKKDMKGYSPACSNEWVRGVCDKRAHKCGECPNQAFIPITDKTIHDHFKGRHVVGVYPMLPDETCHFLAVDFDKGEWKEDVAAFVRTCKMKNIPHAVERSRSGNGAHVWIFFRSPVPASTARKMGCFLLTETMADHHKLPMTSYDRFFPNQDTMPRGGFGNLIALPFQDGPRQEGNSVFVDETWTPYTDQWVFLGSVGRMTSFDVETLANEATEKGQVIGVRMGEPSDDNETKATPWMRPPSRKKPKLVITGPLPPSIQAVLSQQLFIETEGLPSALINQIKRLAAFQNPEFYKKQSMRLPTALTPRVISCAEDHAHHVSIPRGCVSDLDNLLSDLGVELIIEDKRENGEDLLVEFHGELTKVQTDVVKAMTEHDIGVFVAPPGSGKTVVGAHLIAKRQRNTLVLVHRTQLLEQWIAQLSLFLDLKPKEIGQIGGNKKKPNGKLDVAMIQSLVRKDIVDDIVATYGHIIVDECHHVPAVSFERIMREVKARFLTGLTATPRRRDGHHPILQLQLGPSRFTIDPKSQAAARAFDHKLILRHTDFQLPLDFVNISIQDMYRQLSLDAKRNQMILNDVIQALEEKRSPVLLTERRDHLEYFVENLKGLARNLIVLQGGMKTKERREAIARLTTIPESEERLVLATGRFIGEGFDDARLDTLFLALPVSWKGTLVQYAGRLHRKFHAKTEVRVMDYVDYRVPMLARMFEKRMRGYKAMGYLVGDYSPSSCGDSDDYQIEYDEDALSQLE
ncbi:MAG: DEAD/DEAH box helicase [Pirellulales bacterium]|nr:DEAD/DEAH box helicase [Pirellulales bacterium]